MITQKMTTPTDILREREEMRNAGRLAHTPNGDGELLARVGCLCYACRDALDPTGEEDAQKQNTVRITSFPASLKLERQSAVCSCCETTEYLSLPPSSRRVGVSDLDRTSSYTPDHSPTAPVFLKRNSMEKKIMTRLNRLLQAYQEAEKNTDTPKEASTIQVKKKLVEELLKALKE